MPPARLRGGKAADASRRRGCSSMVELQPSKLVTWVRFPSPAPIRKHRERVLFLCYQVTVATNHRKPAFDGEEESRSGCPRRALARRESSVGHSDAHPRMNFLFSTSAQENLVYSQHFLKFPIDKKAEGGYNSKAVSENPVHPACRTPGKLEKACAFSSVGRAPDS